LFTILRFKWIEQVTRRLEYFRSAVSYVLLIFWLLFANLRGHCIGILLMLGLEDCWLSSTNSHWSSIQTGDEIVFPIFLGSQILRMTRFADGIGPRVRHEESMNFFQVGILVRYFRAVWNVGEIFWFNIYPLFH